MSDQGVSTHIEPGDDPRQNGPDLGQSALSERALGESVLDEPVLSERAVGESALHEPVVSVEVEDLVGTLVDPDRWERFAIRALEAEGMVRGHLDMTFVDAPQIAEMKARDLDGDGEPTDVLAYPLDAEAGREAGDGIPVLLGDIVICVGVAERNAARGGSGGARGRDSAFDAGLDDGGSALPVNTSVEAELELLVVHAVLHLVGHDHSEPEEARLMRSREREVLALCRSAQEVPRVDR